MKKLIALVLALVCVFGLVACNQKSGKDFDIPDDHNLLGAKILEIHDDYFIVEPLAGMEDLVSAGKVHVPTRNADPNTDWQVGDLVVITYDGKALETYPVQLGQVYKIVKGEVRLTDNTEASN